MNNQIQLPPPPEPPIGPIGCNSFNTIGSMANPVIRPTTAGLVQYPSLPRESHMQQVHQQGQLSLSGHNHHNPLSSPMFKNELIAKQTQLSNTSGVTIDERIKSRKEEQRRECSIKHLSTDEQTANMPEKLLTTSQREKRPFAYSPEVNDPNNRGKLDLTQIKSPTMRRRLLANMESSSEDSIEDSDQAGQQQQQQQPKQFVSTVAQSQAPTNRKVPTEHHHPRTIANQRETPCSNPPIIQYNERPQFYNLRQGNYIIHQLADQPKVHQVSRTNNNYLDDLGAEVAESLESLSLLVNNLDGSARTAHQSPLSSIKSQDNHLGETIEHEQQRKLTTFFPTSNNNNNSVVSSSVTTNNLEDKRRGRTNYCNSPSTYSNLPGDRLIGDYLLSPGTNYFSGGSNSDPYLMSPFYGSSLDVESCEPMRNWSQTNKQTSHKTFSTNQNIRRHGDATNDNWACASQSHNAHEYSPTFATPVGASIDQQARALREMTARLQTEVERLHNMTIPKRKN